MCMNNQPTEKSDDIISWVVRSTPPSTLHFTMQRDDASGYELEDKTSPYRQQQIHMEASAT